MKNILFNQFAENTGFLPSLKIKPQIHDSATIRNSQVLGNIIIEENVHIVNAVLRADEGTPFFIGKGSNIQDFVTLHGYSTQNKKTPIQANLVNVEGKGYYSIYISENVSLSHGVLVHGPAYVKENTFIGFKSTIDAANVGANVEIGAHSYIKGVTIPDDIGIAPGAIILNEEDIEKYIVPKSGVNKKIVKVNQEMALTYNHSPE